MSATEPGTTTLSRISAHLERPGVIAALWAATTLVDIVNQLLFPDYENGWRYVSSVLFFASMPVLAAFVAAAFGRARDAVLPIAGTLLSLWFLFGLFSLAVQAVAGASAEFTSWVLALAGVLLLAIIARVVISILATHAVSRRRRWAAAAASLSVLFIWTALSMFDEDFARFSAQRATASSQETDMEIPDIDEERLWSAQPRLVEAALGRLPEASAAAEAFVVTVGAGGSQDLFGREARIAQDVLARSFDAGQRTIVLANDEASLRRTPLANNTNLGAVLEEVGRRADDRDVVVIYLTAHGSRQAELQTDLPDYTDLEAIGASSLARALAKAGIRRRIIIVSACYAGSWIKPLASDDTIVVTAARADRTSFGCSDDRELTFFGEALLRGPLATGASLADAFAAARRTVARWEAADKHTQSQPQLWVGKNMQALWTAPRSGQ
ncbi:hypothetical protein H9L13_03155 [Sphingomonas lutea]|uniref:Caspase family protein n=1 Tax=Sphingomonas lutea TaxID=1045317 RepID=A0A7G9SJA7_9SPHN|nr:C13 family peptidase [Sphingomonas lutea]QNN67932.1 hypothetical protein H9L13_03155 [Sphingomonas lutea]